MENETVDEKVCRLASRVEELEKLLFHAANLDRYELIPSCAVCVKVAEFIAKYPPSLNSADSASNTESSRTATETR